MHTMGIQDGKRSQYTLCVDPIPELDYERHPIPEIPDFWDEAEINQLEEDELEYFSMASKESSLNPSAKEFHQTGSYPFDFECETRKQLYTDDTETLIDFDDSPSSVSTKPSTYGSYSPLINLDTTTSSSQPLFSHPNNPKPIRILHILDLRTNDPSTWPQPRSYWYCSIPFSADYIPAFTPPPSTDQASMASLLLEIGSFGRMALGRLIQQETEASGQPMVIANLRIGHEIAPTGARFTRTIVIELVPGTPGSVGRGNDWKMYVLQLMPPCTADTWWNAPKGYSLGTVEFSDTSEDSAADHARRFWGLAGEMIKAGWYGRVALNQFVESEGLRMGRRMGLTGVSVEMEGRWAKRMVVELVDKGGYDVDLFDGLDGCEGRSSLWDSQ
ncbi:hypothetical protein BJ508DRAFT_348822 [Ascobolus immersus RN42]|uniref:Uncharacterized protein n=1 Tax=Ascobolus immersus RN42 TaxID=1160509 RepID=A0A3N4I0R2_ASCIM|nr:hypothetical protein BJ508DRAFT_348822 [Ascobolus immersus RN42]